MASLKPKNAESMKIHLNSFQGGMAIDYKYGISNSFYFSEAMDFRQKPSQMNILPGAYTVSSNLKDLPTVMAQDPNGVRYLAGNQGYVYRVSTSNVVSPIGQLDSNGSAGMVYQQQTDQLYIASQKTVSLYGQVSGTSPQLRVGNFGPSASVANAVIYTYDTITNSYDGGTVNGVTTQRNNLNTLTATGVTPTNYSNLVTNTLTNTYTVNQTTIDEAAGNYCAFVPDIEPAYGIAVYLKAVGSGDLTLTLHDSLNNDIASQKIVNADLVVGWNLFTFSSQIRVIINPIANGTGEGYHFHLTSSAAADTTAVATINSGDLSGANFVYFADRLLQTNNGWHPMTVFNQYLCIGNGPYVSTYTFSNDANPNNSQWVRHQLTLDFGYEVTSMCAANGQLVIAAEKRSNDASRNYQNGFLYFWDGISNNYNTKIEVPMGSPYSVFSFNNVIYFYCAGSLFAYGGGNQILKVRYLGYQNTDYLGVEDSTIVNPNMMATRYNLLMLGYPSSTTNTNIDYGIYSWGTVELTYPNSFGYSYTLANGMKNYSSANKLQVGLVENFVDSMYISWQYTDANSLVHYGIDVIDNTSNSATAFEWQSLIYDGGARYKLKQALRLKINFLPLPAGVTLTGMYNIDRAGWVTADPKTGTAYTAAEGDTSLVIELNNARFHELQWGFTGTTTGVNIPNNVFSITGITMEIDPRTDEIDVRYEDQ